MFDVSDLLCRVEQSCRESVIAQYIVICRVNVFWWSTGIVVLGIGQARGEMRRQRRKKDGGSEPQGVMPCANGLSPPELLLFLRRFQNLE